MHTSAICCQFDDNVLYLIWIWFYNNVTVEISLSQPTQIQFLLVIICSTHSQSRSLSGVFCSPKFCIDHLIFMDLKSFLHLIFVALVVEAIEASMPQSWNRRSLDSVCKETLPLSNGNLWGKSFFCTVLYLYQGLWILDLEALARGKTGASTEWKSCKRQYLKTTKINRIT